MHWLALSLVSVVEVVTLGDMRTRSLMDPRCLEQIIPALMRPAAIAVKL